jgi:adenosylmethionine-8-amino-7-oxononanoate aminotransferase
MQDMGQHTCREKNETKESEDMTTKQEFNTRAEAAAFIHAAHEAGDALLITTLFVDMEEMLDDEDVIMIAEEVATLKV